MPSQPQSTQARNNQKARRAKRNGHQTSSVQASRDRVGAREGKAIREGTWAGPAGSSTARAAAAAAAGPGRLGSSMPRESAEATPEHVAQGRAAYATYQSLRARVAETPALAAQPKLVRRVDERESLMLRCLNRLERRAKLQDNVAGPSSTQASQLAQGASAGSLVPSHRAAPTEPQADSQFGSPGPVPPSFPRAQ